MNTDVQNNIELNGQELAINTNRIPSAHYLYSSFSGQNFLDPHAPFPTQQPSHTLILNKDHQLGDVTNLDIKKEPFKTFCHRCGQKVVTNRKYVNGAVTWGSCMGCAVCCFCLGCCFFPFICDDYKDIVHYCPNCKFEIARWRRW